MLSAINTFSWIIFLVAAVTVGFVILMIYLRPEEDETHHYLIVQSVYCKRVLLALFAIGWFFGDPLNMGALPQTIKTIGYGWLFTGIFFMATFIFAMTRNMGGIVGKKLLKNSINNIIFGITLTLSSYLLWG